MLIHSCFHSLNNVTGYCHSFTTYLNLHSLSYINKRDLHESESFIMIINTIRRESITNLNIHITIKKEPKIFPTRDLNPAKSDTLTTTPPEQIHSYGWLIPALSFTKAQYTQETFLSSTRYTHYRLSVRIHYCNIFAVKETVVFNNFCIKPC